MTTVVGIFDNLREVEQAVQRLAAAGIDDAVYDEAIVSGETGNVGPVGAVLGPGAAMPLGTGSLKSDLPARPDWNAVVRTFKEHLSEYHLPSDVIDAYATTFYHKGKFVLVKTDSKRAEQVMEILRSCGATRVNRHP